MSAKYANYICLAQKLAPAAIVKVAVVVISLLNDHVRAVKVGRSFNPKD